MGYSFPLTNIFQDGWNHQPDDMELTRKNILSEKQIHAIFCKVS
jgi:hypothetical protein